jgi:hypothetical protein
MEMTGALIDVNPSQLGALSIELVGKLGDVLSKGYLEQIDERPIWRRIQLLRYACNSSYARLVRLVIETASGTRRITPRGPDDELYLDLLIPPRERLRVRLERGPVEPLGLPSPFPDTDVRFEVHG